MLRQLSERSDNSQCSIPPFLHQIAMSQDASKRRHPTGVAASQNAQSASTHGVSKMRQPPVSRAVVNLGVKMGSGDLLTPISRQSLPCLGASTIVKYRNTHCIPRASRRHTNIVDKYCILSQSIVYKVFMNCRSASTIS